MVVRDEPPLPTPAELSDKLIAILVGAAGGSDHKWRVALGKVEKLPNWQTIRSNWIVHPMGSAADIVRGRARLVGQCDCGRSHAD